MPEFKIGSKTMNILSFMRHICKPFKGHILGCFATSVVWAIDLPLRPYLTKCLIDSIGRETYFRASSDIVLKYIILYMGVIFVVFIVNSLEEYLWMRLIPRLRKNVGSTLIEVVLKKSYTFYQNHFSGSISSNINNCIGSASKIIKVFDSFFRYALAISLSLYTLGQVNIKFAAGLGIWVGVYLASCFYVAPHVRKLTAQSSQEGSHGLGNVNDILSNILNVKGFAREKQEIERVDYNFARWVQTLFRRDRILVNLYIIQSGSFVLLQGLCFKWLVSGWHDHFLTAGDFVLVFTISLSIYSCLSGFTKTVSEFSESLGTVDAALKIIYAPLEIQDKIPSQELMCHKGEIVFDKVQFHYKGVDPLFQDKSVVIKGGEKVGLVGYSGSGKTTFVNLILRLFDVTSGRILIDGQDIRDVTQDSLRQVISLIPQDPVLFHRSLKENIAYGKLDATEVQIQEASKKAFAHAFIESLPNKYNSLVGERGIKLSGGQRQRIAIARAILKDAPILILDEATSQLDSITEQEIQQSLWNLMECGTTLVIAHRLSTLLHMDRLLVFDRGKIVEDGTHQQLIAKKGLYQRLWAAQVKGFLPENQFRKDN
jgi:ATP-binding cassette subfamily B protein